MRDNDFEGLLPRDDEQQEAEAEQKRDISEILDIVDTDVRLTSGQKILLRWFCGIPNATPPKEQMACWPSDGSDPF